MSNTLPKEKQSAYQRWEMASFGEERPKQQVTTTASIAKLSEQITAAREQARKEGYAAGLADGRETGLKEGRAQAAKEVSQFKQVASSFQGEIAQANELIAQDLLDLSLDLAKAMLKSALSIRPELVLPIISDAVRYLPSVQQPAVLFLSPADAMIVRQFIGDELSKTGWRISEDKHIERGGCRVETASNQIDASMTTRWQRVTSALDKNNDWLET
jgi:flagellar assembly protein FliH